MLDSDPRGNTQSPGADQWTRCLLDLRRLRDDVSRWQFPNAITGMPELEIRNLLMDHLLAGGWKVRREAKVATGRVDMLAEPGLCVEMKRRYQSAVKWFDQLSRYCAAEEVGGVLVVTAGKCMDLSNVGELIESGLWSINGKPALSIELFQRRW